ncbi:MAG: acetylglutamate kinase [Phycisphaeraceae bacterium]|nr:acetylglutamate kinase [Phycisphaeraceae bacterium]
MGGSFMDEPADLARVVGDICFMAAVGMRPIIVHGGGKAISSAMKQAGLEAQFVQGRRYTDEPTLAIAEYVLVNQINKQIRDLIQSDGHRAMGLHSLGSCAVFAKRMFLGGENGRKIDIGYVGEVDWVNADLLGAVIETGVIPVIAPIARDPAGGKLNVNADSVAGHVAAAVKADKLVLISDTHGIRTDPRKDDLATHLTKGQIEKLIDTGVINEGMLPKVEAAVTALEAAVTKVHIIDGRIPHSLLLEIYTAKGIGTEIVLG